MELNMLANKLSAFSPEGMTFGVKKDRLEVHWGDEVKFSSRAEGFTLLKLFLQQRKESMVRRIQELEAQARNERENIERVDGQLKQLEHKSLSEAYTLLATIVATPEEDSK